MTSVIVSDKDKDGKDEVLFTLHTEGKTLDFSLGDPINKEGMSLPVPWGLKVSVVSD